MALNASETELIMSELTFEDTFIQDVTEHDIHSFTLSLFGKKEKAWLFYIEVGTPYMRICKTERMRKKSGKMQRFTQYLKANIIGSRIVSAEAVRGEREVCFTLSHRDEVRKMYIRLFSGPAANIIITDKDNIILEAMMRRPGRGEEKGGIFTPSSPKDPDHERFPVRPWSAATFNEEIDRNITREKLDSTLSMMKKQVLARRDAELSHLTAQLKEERRKASDESSYETYRKCADLLSAYSYQIKRGDKEARLISFEGDEVTVHLDPSVTVSENINAYYQKYKRAERIYLNAKESASKLEEKIRACEEHYAYILSQDSVSLLEKELGGTQTGTHEKEYTGPGLRLESHGFEILAGRNAKENDELLRRHVRGNDLWLHTRDYAGGYVFIRAKKDKSIPLEVLLDGANIAVHYSKAKSGGKASLYYTQVKYLRRVKDGKQGLVIPTCEKNLDITLDEDRVRSLLSKVR
ncbi:MAG: NFACT RNA binding domain-containing protein [Bullifex sp.]